MFFQSISRSLTSILLAGSLLLAATGCKNENRLIEKVTFTPSENLEAVTVSLVFGSSVQADLAGGFALKDYGYLFINPFTEEKPFEVGFSLNTDIVNEQDYVNLEPTTVYPNGVPIGLPYALAQINAPKPINANFDLYGYVDVLHGKWLGVAAIFNFMSDKNFPADLAVTQAFMRDGQGKPAILASVFGPSVDNGTLVRHGGIMLLANVRQLIDQAKDKREITFYPEQGLYINGGDAARYQRQPQRLRKLESAVIKGLNSSL